MSNRDRAISALRELGNSLRELFWAIVLTLSVFFRLLAEALKASFQILCQYSVALVRGLFSIVAVYVALRVAPAVFQAFGGDIPALIPTAAVIILPLVLCLGSGYGWSGLLASSVMTAVVGLAVVYGGVVAQSVVLSGLIVGLFVYKITENDKENHHA